MKPTDSRESGNGLPPGELDELRSAIAALREHLEQRKGRSSSRSRKSKGAPAGARPSAERASGVDRFGEGLARTTRELQDRLSEVDPLATLSELRSRLPFGARAHAPGVDDFGFDAAALERARPWLDFLFDRWWRVHVSGAEVLAQEQRVLFVANRSGVLPYDGLMVAHAIARELGESRRPRFLVADWLAALPFVQPRLAQLGGVRACAENAERLLRQGRWVVAFPEGQKGAVKLFHDRYRLQRFARGGFVSIALREGATIVPVAIVGAEEVHPVLYESRFTSRVLGLPALVTPTFPHLGPLGLVPLPSRWRIRIGEPLRLDGVALERAQDPLYINRTTETIRATIQTLIDQEVRRRSSVF